MRETEVAVALARRAGGLIRAAWNRPGVKIEEKGAINLVTEVDLRSEELITRGLAGAFPEYSILSEEGAGQVAAGGGRWIIDPLDGTTNFVKGYPLVAVSIALEREGVLSLGVVYNPVADELFVAERGRGATLNGAPIEVARTPQLGRALLASGFPYDAWSAEDDNTAEWRAFIKSALSVRCDGSAALDLCHVACGRIDAYWEKGISAWDMAAGALIVAEAGGHVSDYGGGGAFLETGQIVAANPALAATMLATLNAVRATPRSRTLTSSS